jgi:3-methylcrotonyl-CoA carboxylase alpha subunit
MGEAAVKAAKAVGYVGAGTVEFLMEAGTTDFFFCEMNTRLQVEHPVTEMVTGVDLVEWQLRVAAGQELPIKDQADIKVNGHAIEARIYAENPARDFLPATGTLKHLRAPEGPGIRVETGVREGDEVSVFYDPMISKLITYGEDRDAALDKMVAALKRYEVAGMPTNIPFVEKCASHPSFREGGVTTGFLDIYEEDVKVEEGERGTDEGIAIAAVARVTRDREANRDLWNAFTESEVRAANCPPGDQFLVKAFH